ncbi:hypothetical protein R1sor_012927 [Riccia sorocarpa]|uniref:Uncharacterized protein n=1 Tax=Riccia sorocarpa TaxID=122646 RepID=A0ABD3I6B2_9MARC
MSSEKEEQFLVASYSASGSVLLNGLHCETLVLDLEEGTQRGFLSFAGSRFQSVQYRREAGRGGAMEGTGSGRKLLCFMVIAAVAFLVSVEKADAQVAPVSAPAPAPAASSGGYFISYGALTADRVICPQQSGRSYYTANCASATGPARPYERTCSTISLCARDDI